jgi:hypothetical protein
MQIFMYGKIKKASRLINCQQLKVARGSGGSDSTSSYHQILSDTIEIAFGQQCRVRNKLSADNNRHLNHPNTKTTLVCKKRLLGLRLALSLIAPS